MNTDSSESKQSDISISQKLMSVQDLIWAKKFKEARKQLREILQHESNNRRARKLLAQLDRDRRIRNFRIAIVAILLGVAGLFFALGWIKVRSTEVAIDLTVSQLLFTTSEKWEIYSIETQTLEIFHLNDLKLYPIRVEKAIKYDPDTDQPTKWQAIDIHGPLQIKRTEDFWNVSMQSSYLNLSSLVVDSGSAVTVAVNERDQNQFTMRISDRPVFGTAETGHTLIITCSGCEIGAQFTGHNSSNKLRVITEIREIKFRDLFELIELNLKIRANRSTSNPYLFEKSIHIEKIDFTTLEGEKRESTIQEGKIYFAELDGQEFAIKEGDFLIVDGLQDFQIKRLFLGNEIKVSLYGRVRELKSGTQAFLYSRLPSYLEWLQKNESITIPLAILVAAVAAILSIGQLFKMCSESE